MLWKQRSLSRCFSARLFSWQYTYLHWQFHHSIGQTKISSKRKAKLMKKLYDLIHHAVINEDEVTAYKALDLLKLAFGGNMIRPNEAGRIMNLCVISMEKKQYAITDYILDAYRPLIKNDDAQNAGETLRQLMMIIHIAKKVNQEYILSKAANCVFEGIRRIVPDDESGVGSSIDALRLLGLNAIKMNDVALLRETASVLRGLPMNPSLLVSERLSLLLSVWMHQIMKQDRRGMLASFDQLCFSLLERNQLSESVVTNLLADSNNLVGAIAANSRLRCNVGFIEFLLKFSATSVENARVASKTIVKIVKLAAEIHGMQQGFHLLTPLLERGRTLLNDELKFTMSNNELRKRLLFVYVNELIFLTSMIARKDFVKTNVDVMMELKNCWLKCYEKEINRASVNQFCQLAVQQMLKRKAAKKRFLSKENQAWMDQPFLTESQIKHLGFG